MIGDESRRLNQDENLLNLYNVRVKKNNSAATNLIASQTGASDSMSSDTQSVKSLTKAEKEGLHQTDACRNYEDFQIKARSNIDIVLAIAGSVASGDITKSQQNTRHLGKGNIRSISAIKYYIINEGENSDANRRSKTYASAPHVRPDKMATSLNDRLRQLLENRITLAISGVGAERGKGIEEAAVSEIVLKEIENAGITEVDVYICTVQTPRLSLSGVVKKINQPSVQWHQLPSVLPSSADLINLRAYSASEIPEERRKNVQHPQHTSVLNSNIGGKWREVKRLNCINLSIFSLIEGIPTRFVFVGDGYGICGTFMREEMSAIC